MISPNRRLDVLFVEPNSSAQAYQDLSKTYTAIETPTWSLLLAQSCRSKGFGVAIVDSNAERLSDTQTIQRIHDLNPRLVVFVMYGQNPNSGTTNMIGAERLGKSLKQAHPEYPICMVGSHVSALPKEVLALKFVDYVLLNEGVYALANLLDSDMDGGIKHIKGIGWKNEGALILNPPQHIVPQDKMDIDLPGYAWDLLPYDKKPLDLYRAHFWHAEFNHNLRTPFAAIYTSLGCTFKCDFCMINILNRVDNEDGIVSANSNVMRHWSTEFMLKEFDKLANMGVETLRISDEMFFLNRRHFEPLIAGLEERGHNLRMWAYARVDTVRKEFLERFKKVGINWLALGIEAGNQKIRLEVQKGKFQEVNIRDTVKIIHDHEIDVVGNYIFGFPEDTYETMQQTLDLACELNTAHANIYPCQALPGSPLYYAALAKGWKLPDSYEGYAFLSYDCQPLPTNHLSAAEVLRFRDDAWAKYFLRPEYLSMIERKFGKQQAKNIVEMSKIKLKRKLLGD
ncbi:MAG: cobalamin-dependent protein [Anaerolineae bacterium]|nr:cobalamin-dependent protein [Anaerolineae bacterium]